MMGNRQCARGQRDPQCVGREREPATHWKLAAGWHVGGPDSSTTVGAGSEAREQRLVIVVIHMV